MLLSVFLNKKNTSVFIAKRRLQNVLSSDRTHCAPDTVQQLRQDLFFVVSKYIQVKEEQFDLEFTRSDIHIRYTGELK